MLQDPRRRTLEGLDAATAPSSVPNPRAVETRLYLFGSRDLDGREQAVVEYRDVPLTPVASPVDVVLVRQADTAPPATVTYDRLSPAALRGDDRAARLRSTRTSVGTFVALNETSAPGWTAQRAEGIDSTGKLTLQGWMNGWPATSPEGSALLAYGPDKYAQWALKLLPVALIAAIGWIIVRRPVRAWVGRQWRRTRMSQWRQRRHPTEVAG